MDDYADLRPQLKESLDRYAKDRRRTGGFLQCVLENNLFEAVSRADATSVEQLPLIVRYIYNELPIACWGSAERVGNWLKSSGFCVNCGLLVARIGGSDRFEHIYSTGSRSECDKPMAAPEEVRR